MTKEQTAQVETERIAAGADQGSAAVLPPKKPPQGNWLRRPAVQQSWTALAFVLLFVGIAVWLGEGFATAQSRILDVHQSSAIIVLALAAVTTLVAGHFDLSITGMATLSTYMVVGLVIKDGLPFGVALTVALVAGVVGGLINGLLVERFGIHAFIATLATGAIFTGIAAVYSDGQPVSPGPDTGRLPTWFTGQKSFGSFDDKAPQVVLYLLLALAVAWAVSRALQAAPTGASPARWRLGVGVVTAVLLAAAFAAGLATWLEFVSYSILFVVLLCAVMWCMMRYTTFGRHLKAVGANPVAARLAGVNAARVGLTAYVISGFLAALAGVLLAANLGSASAEGAASYLLPAFSAAFLSTVIFSPGQFTIWGAAVSVVLVVWLTQALSIGGFVFTWAAVINGAVLLVAVAVSSVSRRER